jgi:hypothetical protein
MANFVWSKAMDINDDQATGPGSVLLSDSNNFQRDYGPAGFNYPRVFKMSWIYSSPQVRWFGWVGSHILSGWRLNGIGTIQSGKSLNVTTGTDNNFDGFTNDRPMVVGDPIITGSRSRADQITQFFNTAAFAKIPAGVEFGNAGRDILIGPGAMTWSTSASKDFRLTESKRLQFRTDFFNVLNQVNLGNPTIVMSNGAFGKINSAANPRMLQFNLKLYF